MPQKKIASLDMREADRNPLHLLRSPVDLALVTLALMILVLCTMRMDAKRRQSVSPPARIGVEARLAELRQGGKIPIGTRNKAWEALAGIGSSAWDKGLFAILAAEDGDLTRGRTLALEIPDESFRRCWSTAYLGEGTAPSLTDRAAVDHALRHGYGARLLEARLLERQGQDGRPLREEARRWVQLRFRMLIALGVLLLLAMGSGVVFAIFLSITWQRPQTAAPNLSGRELLLVFLGWFLALLLSGTLAAGVISLLPFLRPLALPMVYGFHACVGLGLLCRLQNIDLPGLAGRLFQGFRGKHLSWAGGFALLAVTGVFITTLALSPFLQNHEPPQKDLMDLVTGAPSLLKLLPLLLLASVVAPLFEETLFRGTLLPWLGHRLEKALGPRRGWFLALLLSSLAFAAIHLEPAAFPTISALGFVLGLAFLRTGNLAASVVVHGLWNGSVTLFYRFLMS